LGPAGAWVKRNWIPLALLSIFIAAFLLRGMAAYGPAVNNSPIEGEFVVSGGSDSYYHKRIIDYITTEHRQFTDDPLLNYPVGASNPRPPFWQWSVVVTGYLFSPVVGDVGVAVWHAFLTSTAFWGALSIVPMYFIGKSIFGRKTGLAAAFLLAIEAGHIERTVLSNADHDSFAMFFTLVGFYFFLRALATARQESWISDWKKPSSIMDGLRDMVGANRVSFLYAMMAGVAIAGVALTWKGYSYIVVVLGVYALVQYLVNRFRGTDSTTVTAVFAITTLSLFVVAFPWYYGVHRIAAWFDVPFYIAAAVIFAGIVFSVTRDYPWTLVLPSMALVLMAGAVVTAIVSPDLWAGIVGGQGYLAKNKLYTTIAEAQAPPFSKFVLSFGAMTFFMAVAGVGLAIYNFPKKLKSDYLFIVVWTASTVYMAASAARFLFIASPAFALMSAWMLVLILEKLDFKDMRKKIRGHGGGLRGLRKGVRFRHIAGALILVFLILLPNGWFAVDAGIPYEYKPLVDGKIYDVMPDFLRPPSYDKENGTTWYLGAFGFSMPIKESFWQRASYWPDAWEHLRERDTDLRPEERPAFVSWWDYGFEAVQEGKHPTCADNFQFGYQFAGNVLMSQGEDEAVALFCMRLLDPQPMDHPDGMSPEVNVVLREWLGVENASRIEGAVYHPENYVSEVLSNPQTYGPRSDDLSPINAKYVYGKHWILEALKARDRDVGDFYRALRDATGYDIRYLAVDSRLFPFSGRNTGIFYAPAVLSDHRVKSEYNRVPYDFYEIKLVTDQGDFLPEDLPEDARVKDYKIEYKDMFYNSMLYRTYIGYTGDDARMSPGIPVVSLSGADIKPAWAMRHFRIVYRTMYWNPYSDYENHTTSWQAVSWEEANRYGEAREGIMLPTYAGVYHGVVFIEYYDGAFLNGTITDEEGRPVPHVCVSVKDEYGIPHDQDYTDENGRYSLLAPFGNLTITVSVGGDYDSFNMKDRDEVLTENLVVSDAQAMREPVDEDGDGVYDYFITKDFQIPLADIKGRVYLDLDGDKSFSPSKDRALDNATIVISNETYGVNYTATADDEGYYTAEKVMPLRYDVTAFHRGIKVDTFQTTVGKSDKTVDFHKEPGTVEVQVNNTFGGPVEGAEVVLTGGDLSLSGQTDALGKCTFTELVPGDYSVRASTEGYVSDTESFHLGENETERPGLVLRSLVSVSGSVGLEGQDGGRGGTRASPSPFPSGVLLRFQDTRTGGVYTAVTDDAGEYSVSLPSGFYIVDATYFPEDSGDSSASVMCPYMGQAFFVPGDSQSELNITLTRAVQISGTVLSDSKPVTGAEIHFRGEMWRDALSSSDGKYMAYLVPGRYTLYVQSSSGAAGYYLDDIDIQEYTGSSNPSQTLDVDLSLGARYDVEVLKNGSFSGFQGALLNVTTPDGLSFSLLTGPDGKVSMMLSGEWSGPGEGPEVRAWAFGYRETEGKNTSMNTSVSLILSPSDVEVRGVLSTPGEDPSQAVIVFTPSNPQKDTVKVVPEASGSFSTRLSPGEYSVTLDFNPEDGVRYYANETLRVDVGASALEMDIESVRQYLITGNISSTAPGGEAEDTNATLRVYDLQGYEIYSTNTTVTNNSFQVYLPEGELTVVLLTGDDLDQGDIFTLSSTAPRAVDLTLSPAASIVGTVKGEDIPVPGVNVTLTETDILRPIRVVSDANGDIDIRVPGGSHRYNVDVDEVKMVEGIYQRVTYHETDRAAAYININGDLTPLQATVRGEVLYNGEGVPAILHFYAQEGGSSNTAASNETGHFSLSLVPGDYLV
ncbi:MAG: carboxypeptidase regulatory-like domain-containing protein, partial [Thermoplasmata archaeon]|nr:carboxypeptidase regulatory-like domain-containing protein [Thermoplasmata archaeon]